jgi:hypothetical protein
MKAFTIMHNPISISFVDAPFRRRSPQSAVRSPEKFPEIVRRRPFIVRRKTRGRPVMGAPTAV